jgi:hypothetical protein
MGFIGRHGWSPRAHYVERRQNKILHRWNQVETRLAHKTVYEPGKWLAWQTVLSTEFHRDLEELITIK